MRPVATADSRPGAAFPASTAGSTQPESLRLADGDTLDFGTVPWVMGVVNITPDSFSDGGRWLDPQAAVAHGLRLLDEGADLLDLGAESTRPGGGVYGEGAEEVTPADELDRLLPVLRGLREATDRPISVDTRKAQVADAALAEGASLINDVSALGDPAMASVVAAHASPIVLMHSRGELGSMQVDIRFDDVVGEIAGELAQRAGAAQAAGISADRIVLDPGIGFGKTAQQNLSVLRGLDRFTDMGFPILVGASRKSFIGAVADAEPTERLPGSLAAAGWAAHHRAAILRVHDVAATRQFLQLWDAIDRAEARP